MHLKIQNHKILHWTSIYFSFFLTVSFSDPRVSESGLFCGPNRSSIAGLVPAFTREMQSLSQSLTARRFATRSVNTTPSSPSIYALAQCHEDLSQTDCLLCYAVARTRLPSCLPSTSGRVYLDGCFLRYDDHRFYDESTAEGLDAWNCTNDTVSSAGFRQNVGYVLGSVVRTAVGDRGFGFWGERGVYALAQCWESVGQGGCRACLEKAVRKVKRCVPRREGRGMNAGCYLRYSTEKFYNHGDAKNHGFSCKGTIMAVILATTAFFMLLFFAVYAIYKKLSKKKQERRNLGSVSRSFNRSSLRLKYETLERATDYFSAKRQIGEGGNGSVFVGTLPNGDVVAVKRLVFNTRQWVSDFFNEVNLISGIQHKNLVKLLGCSIEGPESLLVYEYLPNKSLDQFLFDKTRSQVLKWKQRYNIIVGTAEGLAYLHAGSETRIIHRDIKSSNILLDNDLNPKIADFGLARCFAPGQTHLSTGIKGTPGYMAPEYLVRGELTEKADVYSFGVLVLEIVCGKRNNVLSQDSGFLLQTVWKLYRSNRLSDAVDSNLRDEFLAAQETDEATNVLCIGLLCVQATAALRPSMKEIVAMLTTRDYVVRAPTQPPFLMASSSLEPESSVRSYSTDSPVWNTATKTDQTLYTSGSCSINSPLKDHEIKR